MRAKKTCDVCSPGNRAVDAGWAWGTDLARAAEAAVAKSMAAASPPSASEIDIACGTREHTRAKGADMAETTT